MSISRKNFLKGICFSGACICGFGSIAFSQETSETAESTSIVQNKQAVLAQEWIARLLETASQEPDQESICQILRKTADVHYHDLKMDMLLTEYEGNLEKFIQFLQNSWDWKIDYDPQKNILIADENKNYCVCPIAQYRRDINSAAMCYCSEGFAEKIFSKIAKVPVKAEVISSIRRGDASCKYKIVFMKS